MLNNACILAFKSSLSQLDFEKINIALMMLLQSCVARLLKVGYGELHAIISAGLHCAGVIVHRMLVSACAHWY